GAARTSDCEHPFVSPVPKSSRYCFGTSSNHPLVYRLLRQAAILLWDICPTYLRFRRRVKDGQMDFRTGTHGGGVSRSAHDGDLRPWTLQGCSRLAGV